MIRRFLIPKKIALEVITVIVLGVAIAILVLAAGAAIYILATMPAQKAVTIIVAAMMLYLVFSACFGKG